MTARVQRKLTGRHVLAVLLGFFGVMLLVNGIFVYMAMTTWSGLVEDDAYGRGLDYNQTLQAAAAQQALGWDVRHQVEMQAPGQAAVLAQYRRADGTGIAGLNVTAILRRPAQAGHDVIVPLAPGPAGTYRATIVVPFDGQWDLTLQAERADGAVHRLKDRLWLK